MQATVETATYGSEFVAARTCVEQIIDLRQTLRYLGVPVVQKSIMFGDNKTVVDSATKIHAKLQETHCSIFSPCPWSYCCRVYRILSYSWFTQPCWCLEQTLGILLCLETPSAPVILDGGHCEHPCVGTQCVPTIFVFTNWCCPIHAVGEWQIYIKNYMRNSGSIWWEIHVCVWRTVCAHTTKQTGTTRRCLRATSTIFAYLCPRKDLLVELHSRATKRLTEKKQLIKNRPSTVSLCLSQLVLDHRTS